MEESECGEQSILPVRSFVLHLACASDELKLVRKLLANSDSAVGEILERDELQRTALHAAVEGGNPEIVEELAAVCRDAGESVDRHDANGDTPLHLAVRRAAAAAAEGGWDCKMVRLLIDAGGDPVRKNASRETPLLLAWGNQALFKLLVRENLIRADYVERLAVISELKKVAGAGELRVVLLNVAVELGHISLVQDVLDCDECDEEESILSTYDGSNALERAVRGSVFPVFGLLLKKLDKSNIDIRSEAGETLLQLAMRLGDLNFDRLKKAVFLIASGACPFLKDLEGRTPAEQLNGISGVEHFQHADDKNVLRTGVLHFLISLDYIRRDLVKEAISGLLELDASLKRNITMQHRVTGDTALHAAVRSGNPELLQLLLQQAVNITNPLLEHVVDAWDADVAELLAQQNANPDLHELLWSGIDSIKLVIGKLLDENRDFVPLLLHHAVKTCNGDLFQLLQCIPINAEGETPLRVCLKEMNTVMEITVKMARLLLDYGANPEEVSLQQLVTMKDQGLLDRTLESLIAKLLMLLLTELGTRSNLQTDDEEATQRIVVAALQAACKAGNEGMVRHLLEWKKTQAGEMAASQHPVTGETAAHAAVRGGSLSVLTMVLEPAGGGAVAARCANALGQTPLHFALAKGNVEMVKALEAAGAEHITDNTGAGSYHFAARSKSTSALEYLYHGRREEINQRTSEAGLTPLHYAAWNWCGDSLVKWLLDHGAAPSLETGDKVEQALPWEWAAMTGNSDFSKYYAQLHKSLFPGDPNPGNWQRVFQRIEHQCGEPDVFNRVLDLVSWRVLLYVEDKYAAHSEDATEVVRRLGPGLLACAAAYGDRYTTNKLAHVLRMTAIASKECAVSLVFDSHMLEWAARRAKYAESVEVVEPLILVVVELSQETYELQLLRLAFTYAFDETNRREVFLKSLFRHCRHTGLTDMLLKEVVKEKAKAVSGLKIEDWLHRLSRADRELFQENLAKIEDDVPLAFWLALLVTYSKSADKKQGSNDVHEDESLVERVDELAHDFIHGYPNEKGRYTGRAALHWATISKQEEIVRALRAKHQEDMRGSTGFWRDCKPDVYDEYGKPPCWYARNEKALLKFLRWDNYMDNLKNDRALFVDALNAILVGAALISSVTFAGFLNPPLGFNYKPAAATTAQGADDALKYVPINVSSVEVFWVCNSFSFFLGIASALAGVTGILPSPDEFNYDVVEKLRKTLIVAAVLLVFSIVFVLQAFAAASFAGLPPGLKYQDDSVSASGIGGLICVINLIWFLIVLSYFLPYPAWLRYCVWGEGGVYSSKLLGRLMQESKLMAALMPKRLNNTELQPCTSNLTEQEPLAKLLEAPIPRPRALYIRPGFAYWRATPWDDGLDKLAALAASKLDDGDGQTQGSNQHKDHHTILVVPRGTD